MDLCLDFVHCWEDFFVTSNRESGEGRYDIQLKPVKKGLPGIIIELKAEKKWYRREPETVVRDCTKTDSGKTI